MDGLGEHILVVVVEDMGDAETEGWGGIYVSECSSRYNGDWGGIQTGSAGGNVLPEVMMVGNVVSLPLSIRVPTNKRRLQHY